MNFSDKLKKLNGVVNREIYFPGAGRMFGSTSDDRRMHIHLREWIQDQSKQNLE